MLQKPQSCLGCALYNIGQGFSKPEGTGANGVLLLGEALEEQEVRDGLPFRPGAPAGHVLEQAIKSLGMDRQQFVVWNVVACRPPQNELLGASWEYPALEHCKQHTKQVIEQFKPRVIVACGAIPTRVLTGLTGKKMRVEDIQGFALEAPDYPGIRVIPTYHPSYIQRGAWQVFPVLRLALAKAVKLAREGWKEPNLVCITNASASDVHEMADELEAKPELDLNIDFETDGGKIEPDAIESDDEDREESTDEEKKGAVSTAQTITQVNLSVRDNEALAIDFNTDTRECVSRILGTANNKHGHNIWLFDVPVASNNGLEIKGRIDDSMWCLAGETRVVTDQGLIPIKRIVDEKLSVTVASINKQGIYGFTRILNYHYAEQEHQQWVSIKTDGSRFPTVVTPEHEVWAAPNRFVEFRWMRADQLSVGYLVASGKGSDEAIEGMLLGDGNLIDVRTFQGRHCEAQADYAKAKANILGVESHPYVDLSGNTGVWFTASVSASLRSVHYAEDKSRKFTYPLDARTIAIWYQDDGCYSRNGKGHQGRVLWAMGRYAHEGEAVLRWAKKLFGSSCALVRKGKMLRISNKSMFALFDLIAEFVHPCMEYKLHPDYRGAYLGWMERAGFRSAVITELNSRLPRVGHSSSARYCLTVEESTQAFFTASALVHNCFHHAYPDLPGSYKKLAGDDAKDQGSLASLQFCASFYGFPFPWKHLRLEQAHLYGCYDGISGRAVFNGAKRDLERLGVWEGYDTFVRRLRPILADAERRGIPVNRQKLIEFIEMLKVREVQELAKLRPMIPEALCLPKQKNGLKKEPKCKECNGTGNILGRAGSTDASIFFPISSLEEEAEALGSAHSVRQTLRGVGDSVSSAISLRAGMVCPKCQGSGVAKGLVRRTFFLLEPEKCSCVKTTKAKKCKTCDAAGSVFNHAGEVENCFDCQGAGTSKAVAIASQDCLLCKGSGEVKGEVERWCELLDFNPNSPQQVKAYTRYEGPTPWGFKKAYTIPKNSKRKYAMDKETLERLEKTYRDPVCETILRTKSITKFKSVYGTGVLDRLDNTNTLHTQFLFLPATGQLSSSPNVQNFPHPTKGGPLQREYATQFRTAIEAKPGHVLIELDYKSYHACTLAWEAKDWNYLRLAKLDAHSYLTGYVNKLNGYRSALQWDDEKLGAWLADIKKRYEKERNEKFKPAILGWGFGLGGARLYNINPEAFSHVREAMGVFDALDSAFPVTAQYRRDSPELAHRQKHLKSAFGCIRWFWNVKAYNFRKKDWDHGMDWDKAIAFRPANDAFSQKKLALLACEEKGYNRKYGFCNDIHDAFKFHCREELAEECIHNVREEMERPSTVMLMPDNSGFSVEVEEKIGRNWADMKSWKKWVA